jgi:hypothetical protein
MVIDMMSCELIVCKGTTTTHIDHFSQVDYATKEITPTHGQPIFYNALEFTIELV